MAENGSGTRTGGGRLGARRARRAAVRVRNVTRGTMLAEDALVAGLPLARLVGLIGRQSLPQGAGLILLRTPWVHTAFMSFPIDVVFYSHGGYALLVVEHLAPWRVSPICWRAYAALELSAGTVLASGTRAGDLLRIDTVAAAAEPASSSPVAQPATDL